MMIMLNWLSYGSAYLGSAYQYASFGTVIWANFHMLVLSRVPEGMRGLPQRAPRKNSPSRAPQGSVPS